MKYQQQIQDAFFEIIPLFEKSTTVKNDLQSLTKSVELVGDNSDIASAIKTKNGELENLKNQLLQKEDILRNLVKSLFPEIFTLLPKTISFESFSLDTDPCYQVEKKEDLTSISFVEQNSHKRYGRKIFVNLQPEEYWATIEAGSVPISFLKIDEESKDIIRAEYYTALKSIKYFSGYFNDGGSPPFQAGYSYNEITRSAFLKKIH